jgi:pyridoxal phosphate enzyme (YggS family)
MTDVTADVIAARLREVADRIADAARGADRSPDEVTLIAVSKMFGTETIERAIAAGQRVFGENRVQEALQKWPAIKQAHSSLELHLIGPLQSNKAKQAHELFDVIETVDRPKIAGVLADLGQATGRMPRLFVQVNTGAEPQKAGILPESADEFLAEAISGFGLKIDGLMCIPPIDEEPALHFALLDKIAQRNGIENLSMGMSADFETAIGLGASHIRLGTAIFGERPVRP